MKLHLSRAEGLNQITSCGIDFVSINGVRHEHSLIVTPEELLPQWPVSAFDALSDVHIAALLPLKADVVLIGTGARLRFPRAHVLRPLIDARVGYEIMDTGAACRTYNVLIAEGRRVAAALILA